MDHAGGCRSLDFDETSLGEATAYSAATSWYRVGYMASRIDSQSKHTHSQVSFLAEVFKADPARARESVTRLATQPSRATQTDVQGLEVHHVVGFIFQGLLPRINFHLIESCPSSECSTQQIVPNDLSWMIMLRSMKTDRA